MGRAEYNMHIFYELVPSIDDESKDLEVRPRWPGIEAIEVGTIIRYNGNDDLRRIVVRVTDYDDLDTVTAHEEPQRILPGVPNGNALLTALHSIFPPEVQTMGFRVFELASFVIEE